MQTKKGRVAYWRSEEKRAVHLRYSEEKQKIRQFDMVILLLMFIKFIDLYINIF